MEDQIDGDLQLDENCFHLQLDGASAHYICQIRQRLDQHYPENRFLARSNRVAVAFKNLALIDFFLLGNIKSVVYKTKLNNGLPITQNNGLPITYYYFA